MSSSAVLRHAVNVVYIKLYKIYNLFDENYPLSICNASSLSPLRSILVDVLLLDA